MSCAPLSVSASRHTGDSRAVQTAEHGCIPIAAVSSSKGLGVTVTSGSSGLDFPELNQILSATKDLLKVFRFDSQADETPGLDSYMGVPMLEAFVHGSHAMPRFNDSSYALTLWENVPQQGSVKVPLSAHVSLCKTADHRSCVSHRLYTALQQLVSRTGPMHTCS